MTATLWLLAGLAWLLLSCLFALFMGRFIGNRWNEVEQALEYRTADWSTIESDTKRIQGLVPDANLPAKGGVK